MCTTVGWGVLGAQGIQTSATENPNNLPRKVPPCPSRNPVELKTKCSRGENGVKNPVNKLALLKARNASIDAMNLRSEVASQALAAKLAGRADQQSTTDVPAQAHDPRAKLKAKIKIANTALGFELDGNPNGHEINRIIQMPIITPMEPVELEEYCRLNILADAFADKKDRDTNEVRKGFRFKQVQAEAIFAYEQYNGGFFPIGVGWGKTLISLVIAHKAYAKGLRKIMLTVPPQVMNQLTNTDIKWARGRVPFSVPVHLVGGRDLAQRKQLTESGKKGVYILPYSYLSVKDTSDMLLAIKPELVIADEAHNLANRTSARTKRLMNYIEEFKPEMVCLSGTITAKSIRDYFHLIKNCLPKYNPLPNSMHLANDWASVIDAQSTGTYGEESTQRNATGPLMPLIRWAERFFPTEEVVDKDTGKLKIIKASWPGTIPGFRKAYKKRMTTAPGVVSSGDATIGTSLIIATRPVKDYKKAKDYDKLEELFSKVENEWLTPNGDEIEHAIHTWKWLNELTVGFYNQLTWPEPADYAKRRKISDSEAEDIIRRAIDRHTSGQYFSSALRKWLEKNQRHGCDTPLLVTSDMAKHGSKNVGEELYGLWKDWHAQDFPDCPERDSTAIRVCDYKIRAAVEWAKEIGNDGGIIWYMHQEVGKWCHEELVKAGIDAVHCPAGDRYNALLADETQPLKKKIAVCSLTAHGTGKNLQYFHNNYFLQWPRSDIQAEQTLGRTHRQGQEADELIMTLNITNEFDQLNFAACLNDSLYIHQTTGNVQKLIYAVYDPNPKYFPPAVIHERGLENRILSRDQEEMMRERFGQ